MDPASRIGTTLRGKWRIDRLLGTGGFASVYAATHRAGKRVAIKVLHAALGASEEVRRSFLKEAYAANAVEHPGVVGVSDDDVTEDGAPFLVMDLLDGQTAEAHRQISGGKLPPATVLHIAEETLGALTAAHAKGIVHRDLKPENLFLTKDGQVKVLDFGIARFREPGDESTSTTTGLTMGSPAFMAPEQARGRWSEVDARTDLYAVGATMFVLLSGRLVHGKRNLNEALIDAATKPAPPLASIAPHVPTDIAAVVDRALAFEKDGRWPDAATMREAVRAAKASVGSATVTMPLGPAAATAIGSGNTPWGAGPPPDSGPFTNAGISFAASPTAPLPMETAAKGYTEIPSPVTPTPGTPISSPMTSAPPVVSVHDPASRSRKVGIFVALGMLALAAVAPLVWIGMRPPARADATSNTAPTPAAPSTPQGDTSTSDPASAPGPEEPGAPPSPGASSAQAPSTSAKAPAAAAQTPATAEPTAPAAAALGNSAPPGNTAAGAHGPTPAKTVAGAGGASPGKPAATATAPAPTGKKAPSIATDRKNF